MEHEKIAYNRQQLEEKFTKEYQYNFAIGYLVGFATCTGLSLLVLAMFGVI